MKKKIILTLALLVSIGTFSGVYSSVVSKNSVLTKISANQTAVKKPVQVNTQKQPLTQNPQTQQKVINTTALAVVNSPEKYLNKTIKMQATFDKFSTLGLDYSKALRKSSDYIGILILRDDVLDHNIPLSEMKLFMKKDLAEKHIDLDTGDKIEIVAKEFSTALSDPWLDIESLTVIKKIKKEEK